MGSSDTQSGKKIVYFERIKVASASATVVGSAILGEAPLVVVDVVVVGVIAVGISAAFAALSS